MESTTTRSPAAAGSSSEHHLGGDLRVNRLGFGAMRIARDGWSGPARDPETGRAVLRRAVELGVNHIDTADFYRSGDGAVRANVLIREALHPYPSGLVIATKVGPTFGPSGPAPAAAGDLRRLVEANLQSLGLDRLDLVYLRIGVMTPPRGESIAERFAALTALREEGLIRHLGLSNVDADHIAEARAIGPVSAVQNLFHFAKRSDAAILDACATSGIAFVPFGPIGSGHTDLSRARMGAASTGGAASAASGEPTGAQQRSGGPIRAQAGQSLPLHLFSDARLARVAARHDATVSQIALAWLLALSPVTLGIPGTGSIAHLEENMAAGSIVLTDEDLADLAVTGEAREEQARR